jgi:serine/threonine-protein kinase
MLVDLNALKKPSGVRASGGYAPAKTSRLRSPRVVLGGLAVVLVVFGLYFFLPRGGETPAANRKSIAVLPFENLSANPENEYFSDGITEDIIAHLSKIGDLKVISRTSSMQYKNTSKSMRTVGEELGVVVILEGSVRREDEQIRIVAQLIDARSDEHLWVETYDRNMTQIFAIQSDVARKISLALKATLSPQEAQSIAEQPTDNLEAYQAYLRALSYSRRPGYTRENKEFLLQNLRRAVELDPGFMLAHALLSRGNSSHVIFGYDTSDERKDLALRAAERALELAPDSPEAYLAIGYYQYYIDRDYDQALETFALAEQKSTGKNAEIWMAKAYVLRRQGQLTAAAVNLEKSLELDPRNPEITAQLAETYMALRKYDLASQMADLSLGLAPEQTYAYTTEVTLSWMRGDHLEVARRTLESMPPTANDGFSQEAWFWQEVYERRYQDAIDRLEQTASEWIEYPVIRYPRSLLTALAYHFMNEPEFARAAYNDARSKLESEARSTPNDARIHAALGYAYAGLGRSEDARREAKRVIELVPVEKDAYYGGFYAHEAAAIFAMAGDAESALKLLEYLLSNPEPISVARIELDPRWEAIRDHPKYHELVEKYSGVAYDR